MSSREISPLLPLLLGGVLGAAQATVMWGLTNSDFIDEAGWVLLIAPLGAFFGVLVAAQFVGFKVAAKGNWVKFCAVWCLAFIVGFPVALVAPIVLVGLGPKDQKYRFFAFFLEYGVAWGVLYLLCRANFAKK